MENASCSRHKQVSFISRASSASPFVFKPLAREDLKQGVASWLAC